MNQRREAYVHLFRLFERRDAGVRSLAWVSILILSGCAGGISALSTTLAPAPNLYTFETGAEYPSELVAPGLRSTQGDILYVTNRDVAGQSEAGHSYGADRSQSMAFGVAGVDYGAVASWEELVTRTQTADLQTTTKLRRTGTREVARFPSIPLPFEPGGGRLQTTRDANAAYDARSSAMRAEVSARMKANGQSRVLVYIHGVDNEFDDAINTLATIWHYAGRQSLPVAYSWPAGNAGLFGYFRDSEAGSFSVFHVKEFLRLLASVPEVNQIDIVAHSRGNAVMMEALRELIIEARAAGRDPQNALKLGMLVMAAADIDVGVMRQRMVAERVGQAFEQKNIYANPDDRALRLSSIFGKDTRIGGRDADSFTPEDLASFERIRTVNTILVEDAGGRYGHSYFRDNPAVLSDIVLALRSRSLPGTPFRPLDNKLGSVVWTLHPDYPADPLPEMLDLENTSR
ncbi:MAG: alpha/beta hydrolase [Pseudomonadota bacterium]